MAAAKVATKIGAIPCSDPDKVIEDPDIDAVAIVTPPNTHRALAEACVKRGKHVFVEKPLAHTVHDAEILLRLARDNTGVACCVGHTFIFSPMVEALRVQIDKGVIGEVQFINTYRLNMGRYQACGVWADLLPHDLSILEYLVRQRPEVVCTTAVSIEGVDSAGSAAYTFPNSSIRALINLSWLHTEKTRKLIVVGTEGTLEYDMANPHLLTLFKDRVIKHNQPGHVQVINVEDHAEPLRAELEHFLYLAKRGRVKESSKISFEHGRNVVRAIEETVTCQQRHTRT